MKRQMPVDARIAKFELGEVVVTPAAARAIADSGHVLAELLDRHRAGDWGDVSMQTRSVNERGLTERFGVQSVFEIDDDAKIVIVTDRQRSRTIVHLEQNPG